MSEKRKLPFGRSNYVLMLVGLFVLVLGFIFMTLDTAPYGFGAMGLTVGPITVMLGFMMQFIAIIYKKKTDEPSK